MARTPGEVTCWPWGLVYDDEGRKLAEAIIDGRKHTKEDHANAKTWAIAHTAANKIDAMGFSGDKAIELLPSLLEDWQSNERACTGGHHDGNTALYIVSQFIQAISEKDGV